MTAQTPATLPVSTTTPPPPLVLTGPLKCWLLDERSDEIAVQTIRKSPILAEQAKAQMPALRSEARRPATKEEVEGIISQRFPLFPQPARNLLEWAAWWADYHDALEGLTRFAIEAGMAAWVKSPEAEFMVRPGKLAELARTTAHVNPWVRAYRIAEKATAEEPKPLPAPSERPSAEEIRRLTAGVIEHLKSKDPFAKMRTKYTRPTPCASVDGAGISEEARALLAKQQAA